MDENIIDVLKILADKRMETSLIRVREKDPEYKRMMEQVIRLEKEYEALDLRPEVKIFMDSLLAARDEANMDQMSSAYLAGLEDCILILRSLGILQL